MLGILAVLGSMFIFLFVWSICIWCFSGDSEDQEYVIEKIGCFSFITNYFKKKRQSYNIYYEEHKKENSTI